MPSQAHLLIEYGADVDAKAQKRDICNGAFLTCDQLAQEVGFSNYEQVKDTALKLKMDALEEDLIEDMNRTFIKHERINDGIVANDWQNRRKVKVESGSQSKHENSAHPQKRNEKIKENIGNKETPSDRPESDKVENTTNDAKREERVEQRRDVGSWMKKYKKKKNPSAVSGANAMKNRVESTSRSDATIREAERAEKKSAAEENARKIKLAAEEAERWMKEKEQQEVQKLREEIRWKEEERKREAVRLKEEKAMTEEEAKEKTDQKKTGEDTDSKLSEKRSQETYHQ